MKKAVVLLICFLLFVFFAFTQQIEGVENDQIFRFKVKQFNEFVNRFNYKTDLNGSPIDSNFIKKIPRYTYLFSLFDKSDQRFQNNQSDCQYGVLIQDFIDDVVDNRLKINQYSTDIVAECKTKVRYKKKDEFITINMKQEVVQQSSIKWVLFDVEASFYNFKKDTSLHFISPTNHETNFIQLTKSVKKNVFSQSFAYDGFDIDKLSLFFYDIYKGDLQLMYVDEVVYHINSIPGWKIKVKQFLRNTENSGWLISDIEKIQQ